MNVTTIVRFGATGAIAGMIAMSSESTAEGNSGAYRFFYPSENKATLLARNPTGRVGESPEFANAVLFLASEEASFVSGATLDVTGAI